MQKIKDKPKTQGLLPDISGVYDNAYVKEELKNPTIFAEDEKQKPVKNEPTKKMSIFNSAGSSNSYDGLSANSNLINKFHHPQHGSFMNSVGAVSELNQYNKTSSNSNLNLYFNSTNSCNINSYGCNSNQMKAYNSQSNHFMSASNSMRQNQVMNGYNTYNTSNIPHSLHKNPIKLMSNSGSNEKKEYEEIAINTPSSKFDAFLKNFNSKKDDKTEDTSPDTNLDHASKIKLQSYDRSFSMYKSQRIPLYSKLNLKLEDSKSSFNEIPDLVYQIINKKLHNTKDDANTLNKYNSYDNSNIRTRVSSKLEGEWEEYLKKTNPEEFDN